MACRRMLVFFLLAVLSSCLSAAPQHNDDDDRVIDLQELLFKVQDGYTAFGKLMKEQVADIKATLNNFKVVMGDLKIALGEVKTAAANLGTADSDIKNGLEKTGTTLNNFGKNLAVHFEKSSEALGDFGRQLNDHFKQSSTSLNTFGGMITNQNQQTTASLDAFRKMIQEYFKGSAQICTLGGANFEELKATLNRVKDDSGSVQTSVLELKNQIQTSSGSIRVLVQDHIEIKNSLAGIRGTTNTINNLSNEIKNNIGTCSSSIVEFIKEQKALKEKLNEGFQNIQNKIETSCNNDDGNDGDDGDDSENNGKPFPVRDCADIYKKYGHRTNGRYNIKPDNSPVAFAVRCDMSTDGGGWTVVQRRGEFGLPTDYFFKTWNEYKKGFGSVNAEFWLGNDRISEMTKKGVYQLRVDLWDMEGENVFAKYSTFKVDNEATQYKLTVSGYTGNAGDSLIHHSGMRFSTKDRDNDASPDQHCAADVNRGAWWYRSCYSSNLNGLNLRGHNSQEGHGIEWFRWKGSGYSLAATEMKIRPKDFSDRI